MSWRPMKKMDSTSRRRSVLASVIGAAAARLLAQRARGSGHPLPIVGSSAPPAVGYSFGLGVRSTPDRLRFVVDGAAADRADGSALPQRTRTRNDGFVETAKEDIRKSATDILAG